MGITFRMDDVLTVLKTILPLKTTFEILIAFIPAETEFTTVLLLKVAFWTLLM